jgi:hypothetical protein
MFSSVCMYIWMVEFGATNYHISNSREVYQPQSIFISFIVFFSYLTVEVTYDACNIVRCALVIGIFESFIECVFICIFSIFS